MLAGEVLTGYLAEQAVVLHELADGARHAELDPVHDSRIAARRARSALRVFRRLVRRDDTDDLVTRLRWYGQVLGPVRDGQVLGELLAERLDELTDHRGPVVDRIAAELAAHHRLAVQAMATALEEGRHDALLDAIDTFVADPPLRSSAADAEPEVLLTALEKAQQRVVRMRLTAREHPTGWEHHWHEVRKKAKSARYGAEVVVPVSGEQAEASAAAWKKVTSTLGDVQDGVLVQDVLRGLARRADAVGEPLDTYAELYERERVRMAGKIAEGDALIDKALELAPTTWEVVGGCLSAGLQ